MLRVFVLFVPFLVFSLDAGAGEFSSGVFLTLAGPLSYRLFVPSPRREIRHLIVALHGCKEDGGSFSSTTRLNEVAGEDSLVLYPEQSVIRNWDRCWNWFLPFNQQRDGGEPGMIVSLVDSVARAWSIGRDQTFLVGLSAGGAMAANLASCYPDRFAGVGIHSGLQYKAAESMWEAENVLHSGSRKAPELAGKEAASCSGLSHLALPLIVIHGTLDKRVNLRNAEQLLEQFAWTNGHLLGNFTGLIPLEPFYSHQGEVPNGYDYRFTDYGRNGDALLRKVIVKGLAHAWSGGPGGALHTDPKGPDATRMMIDFFLTERSTLHPEAKPFP